MMPVFLRCDKGTETGKMASIHCYLMSTEHSMFDDPVESIAFGPSAGSFFLCLFSVYSLIFPSRVAAVAPSTIFLQVNRFCVFLPQLSYSPMFFRFLLKTSLYRSQSGTTFLEPCFISP